MITMNTNTLHPHPFISLLPLAVLIALIALVLRIFPDDALSGASQVALMVASSVCVALSMLVYKTKWTVFEEMIKKTVGDAGVSILILLLIGMMSATWMVSGVVPTMIYYGVQLMSPWLFLPCACIISSFISVITGTSWTTIATIGIALMGIGDALGIPQPYTAGAIISGAYFGDKMSPMSDTTVLASSMAGADLFSHIRYMLYTTVPSIVISLVLYLVIGLFYNGQEVEVNQYLTGLNNGFNISLWTMVVPLFTALLIYKKMPSLITLLLSSLAACLCAVVLQPEALMHIAGEKQINALSLFEGLMLTCYTKTNIDTGFEAINSLVVAVTNSPKHDFSRCKSVIYKFLSRDTKSARDKNGTKPRKNKVKNTSPEISLVEYLCFVCKGTNLSLEKRGKIPISLIHNSFPYHCTPNVVIANGFDLKRLGLRKLGVKFCFALCWTFSKTRTGNRTKDLPPLLSNTWFRECLNDRHLKMLNFK